MFNDAASREIKAGAWHEEFGQYKEIMPEKERTSEPEEGTWRGENDRANEIIRKYLPDHQAYKSFWDDLFGFGASGEECDASETEEADVSEKDLEQTVEDYIKDLKDKSECPETIPDRPFEASDLEKLSPEETAKRREEFDDIKGDLKKQWAEEHGRPWPKYEHDVYSTNGKLIRKAGSDYDAHHIQPLGMGGKNEAKNITPLNAADHYDKQGVHSPDSSYTKMDKMLGGAGS